jgi:hypothetical protein
MKNVFAGMLWGLLVGFALCFAINPSRTKRIIHPQLPIGWKVIYDSANYKYGLIEPNGKTNMWDWETKRGAISYAEYLEQTRRETKTPNWKVIE